MTAQQINEIPDNKIKSVTTQAGTFGRAALYKIFKDKGRIIVVTRAGILRYLGNAEYAYYSGVKGKHYKSFKTATGAAKFLTT